MKNSADSILRLSDDILRVADNLLRLVNTIINVVYIVYIYVYSSLQMDVVIRNEVDHEWINPNDYGGIQLFRKVWFPSAVINFLHSFLSLQFRRKFPVISANYHFLSQIFSLIIALVELCFDMFFILHEPKADFRSVLSMETLTSISECEQFSTFFFNIPLIPAIKE